MSTRELVRKLNGMTGTQHKETLTNCGVSLCCALLSCVSVMGAYAPFGVAAAVFDRKRGIFALLGALAGYVVFYTPGSLLSCAALLLAFGVKNAVAAKSRRQAEKLAPLLCGLAVMVCDIPRVLFADDLIYEAVALVAQGVLTLGAAWILSRAAFADAEKSVQERIFLFLAVGAAAVGMSCLLPWEFNPIRSLLLLFVLWAGLAGGVACGGALGVVCGGLLALTTQSPFFLFPFCLGGYTAGLLRRPGKAAAVVSLLVCAACSLAVCGVGDKTLLMTLELLAGCVVLLLVPDTAWEKLAEKVFPFTVEAEQESGAAERLYRAGVGLQEAADCIAAVADKLNTVNAGDPAWVYESAAETVCARCGLKNKCWNEAFSLTTERLSSALPLLDRFGRISRSDLPGDFVADCPKAAEMAAALNRFYGEYALKKSTDTYAVQMRGLLSEQFGGLAGIVKGLAGDMKEAPTRDRVTARRIADLFENECIHIRDCVCLLDKRRRMSVRVAGGQDLNEIRWEKFLPRLCEASGRAFLLPRVTGNGQTFCAAFTEKAEYRLETAVAGAAVEGETVSGDQWRVFEDEERCLCLISDGMGSGRAASVESKMTVTLMQRLIGAGFSYPAALSVVNWALMVKGADERLATADLLAVDLHNGNASLMKAGAAPSFLRRGRDVKEIAFPSLPVGILTQVDAQTRPIRLAAGDLVVMVSDGALYGDNEWLRRELLTLGDDVNVICAALLKRAKARRPSNEDDDVTVLCARLVREE